MRKSQPPTMTPQENANPAPNSIVDESAAPVDESQRIELLQTQQDILKISQLLNTGLSPRTLDICMRMFEAGVHPEALAEVVRELLAHKNAGGGNTIGQSK